MTDKQVLHDKTKNGKERPWRDKKINNVTYAEYLKILQFKKANNVRGCGEVMRFVADDTGHLKLYQTWFCKSRLCPLCNWRRSLKNTNQLRKILEEARKQKPTGRFIFLTLTTRDANDSKELKSELRKMGSAVIRLMRYKKINKNLLGYVRTTEVTVNDDYNTIRYHQHMHLLVFVKPNYFQGTQNYIPATQWSKLWRRAMKLDYDPVVNVELVKPNKKKGTDSLTASVQEVGKYQVKDSDVLTSDPNRNLQVIEDLETGLANSRAISYAGILKTIRHDLKLEDENDLIDLNDDEKSDDETVNFIIAKWNFKKKNYYIQ